MTVPSVGSQGKRVRSEPVIIPVVAVRDGCSKLADNITELSEHASLLLEFDEEIVTRRVAYILVIHAMDEAGKLLEIMKKMAQAESTGAIAISIEGFYSHKLKGSEAGTIGLLTIDWLDKISGALVQGANSSISLPFKDYRIHLKRLQEDFPRERETALYVDFDGGVWTPPEVPEASDIETDAYLLTMLALFTKLGMSAGRSFADLNDFARQVSSMDHEELMRRLRKQDTDRDA